MENDSHFKRRRTKLTNGMSGLRTASERENMPPSWWDKGAAAQSAANVLAKESSQLTMTTPPEPYEGYSASSVTPPSAPSNSTELPRKGPPNTYRVSHETMQCVFHWWNPAMYVKGHQCQLETYLSND